MSEARTTPRRKTTRKRSAEVLDATARVFHEKGYEATSIQDIADELGILKGSVYYYITSKEDLLFEVLEEVHSKALDTVRQAVDIDGDPLQKIRAYVETLSRFNAENQIRMGILLHDFRSLSEPRRKLIVSERDLYEQILRKLIQDGQKQQIICPDIDPKMTTLAVMGMINTIYQWYRPAGKLRPAYIGAAYADLVIRALACTPDNHQPGHLSQNSALPTA